MQQREYVVLRQLFARVEEVQFNNESHPDNVGSHRFRQLCGCLSGPTSSQQVIHNDHALAFLYGVTMHFEGVRTVLERVVVFGSGGWQLSRLSGRDKGGIEPVRQGWHENKTA